MFKWKCAKLLLTDRCVSFECKNNGSGEDDDKLSDEDEDGKITHDNDSESELDDGTVLRGIDNSDEDEKCWEQSDLGSWSSLMWLYRCSCFYF